MDPERRIALMKAAHLLWMRAFRKYGPNSLVTRIRRGELEAWLNACAPAPKTKGHA